VVLRSMRFRITAIATVVVGLVLLGVAAALVASQDRQLIANLDTSLRQRADDIVALLVDDVPAELGAGGTGALAQLVAADGSVAAASANLIGRPAIEVGLSDSAEDRIRSVSTLTIEDDDDSFRILSRSLELATAPYVLHVGASLEAVGEASEALTSSLAIAIPFVVVLLAGLIWLLVGRTLRPVEAIRAEVAAIDGNHPDHRVPVPGTGDEIALLAGTMNLMLERLAHAATQQQRFVADASHELRSPLTRMRSELEVDLLTVRDTERVRLESIRDEVVGLQQLVEDLLHLARTDAGEQHIEPVLVDMDDIVFEAARTAQAHGRLTVDLSGVSGAQVHGDRSQLRRAVQNIVDNAERYAVGRITISLIEVSGWAQLTVADDGPGIPDADRDLVFERFGRLDDSRNRRSGGTGLGLAIAREIVRRHGGDIDLVAAGGPGATFVMRLPLAV
jgi:signal transduction histidine kinase